jgi:crotonobetainyl-CoA hydratase
VSEILLDTADHIATVTINRPERLNALSPETSRLLAEAIEAACGDDGVWTIILTGAGGRAFCAGADIKWLDAHPEATPGDWVHRERLLMRPLAKPLIAVVGGYCFGGGLEIALAADIIVAEAHAVFAFPEAVNVGSYPGDGGPFRIMRELPHRIALEFLLTGRRMEAREALQYGLVNRIVGPGEGLDEARGIAGEINRGAPVAVRLTKRLALEGLDLPLHVRPGRRSAWDLYAAAQEELHGSEDWRSREATWARSEKRPPHWSGRMKREAKEK